MQKKNIYTITFLLFTFSVFSQKVKTEYKMIVSGILYESLILFDDGTYKLTSEYDLYFETSGKYEIIENYIFLAEKELYENAIKLNPKLTPGSIANKFFKIRNDEIFIIKNGKIKRRIFDKSLRKGLSNIFGHKYRYKKFK